MALCIAAGGGRNVRVLGIAWLNSDFALCVAVQERDLRLITDWRELSLRVKSEEN